MLNSLCPTFIRAALVNCVKGHKEFCNTSMYILLTSAVLLLFCHCLENLVPLCSKQNC